MPYIKRKHVRHETEGLKVAIRAYGTFIWSPGSLINLSQGGVQIYTPKKYKPGVQLEIEFTTVNREGGRSRRKLAVKVVWQRGFKYGCEFVS